MKTTVILALFFIVTMGMAQDRPAPAENPQQNRPSLGKEPNEQRPSLGGDDNGPSLGGPRNSTTTDPKKLMHIRTIYIERIDNSLGDKLAEGISKAGRFKIVDKAQNADAVMRGTCFDSRRLKSLHSEVFLADRASGAAIWQDVVRRPLNPPALERAVNDTALLIVAHLNESVSEAQRK